jgi:hypothetical protein
MTMQVYVNGTVQPIMQVITGNLSNWVASWPFAIGNEVTLDRSWLGEVYLVAVYDRALTGEEVLQNYQAGP